MSDDIIKSIQNLKADDIQARLDQLAEQERTLRVLLRSARATERAAREKQKAGNHAR